MRLWRRFRALSPENRTLVGRAAALLCLVRIGLWVLPFARLRAALDRYAGRGAPPWATTPADLPARVAWAVATVARRAPAMTCLVQALAADALLRRGGRISDLRIGVRKPTGRGGKPLEAHAWVVCEGRVVAGAVSGLEGFAVLARPAK